jgi:hypothetical protein
MVAGVRLLGPAQFEGKGRRRLPPQIARNLSSFGCRTSVGSRSLVLPIWLRSRRSPTDPEGVGCSGGPDPERGDAPLRHHHSDGINNGSPAMWFLIAHFLSISAYAIIPMSFATTAPVGGIHAGA